MVDPRKQSHVSPNRLEGSLGDTPLERILEACHAHLLTATLRIRAFGGEGRVELRAGAVDEAVYGDLSDSEALARMKRLGDGLYELTQRLPDLSGQLGTAAQFEGDVSEVTLVALMRHCEDNALTCRIELINDFDRGEILYRAGEIVEVRLNGVTDDDNILDLVRFERARFRVSAMPLDLDIEGWPSLRREPTQPFRLAPAGPDGAAESAAPDVPAPDVAAPDTAADLASATTDRVAHDYDEVVLEFDDIDAPAAPATAEAGEEDDASVPGSRDAALWFGIGAVTALAALGAAFVIAAFAG